MLHQRDRSFGGCEEEGVQSQHRGADARAPGEVAKPGSKGEGGLRRGIDVDPDLLASSRHVTPLQKRPIWHVLRVMRGGVKRKRPREPARAVSLSQAMGS